MERYLDVPGGRLFVVDEGAGPPVLLLHAAIVDHTSWDAVAAGIIAAGYRAVRYDLRGWGRSSTEHVLFSNRADLIAVLDALGLESAALVGNSAGGHIAIDTAIEFPERISAVIAVGADIGGFEPEPTADERALFEEMERLEAAGEAEAIAALDVRVWVDGPGQPVGRAALAIRDAVIRTDRALHAPGHVLGRPTPLAPPANDRLADLRCPILAVAGALDVSDTLATLRRLEEAAPFVKTVVVPDVAHLVGMEAPSELTRLVTDFLHPLGSWA
jgi:pimeloyl-ACP methyl ester carboxylesterase